MKRTIILTDDKYLKRSVIAFFVILPILFAIFYDKSKEFGLLFVALSYFLFVLFVTIYTKIETKFIEKHGVWIIVSVTDKTSTWFLWHYIHYKFQYNNQSYIYSQEVDVAYFKKTNIGNRFFMIVASNKKNRHRKKDAVPEWFTLDAPPEGWKKCPTEMELREMMRKDAIQQAKYKMDNERLE